MHKYQEDETRVGQAATLQSHAVGAGIRAEASCFLPL